MTEALRRYTNVRREEVWPVLASAFFFFCVLTALMVLRPARDALGMQGGMDAIRWLFIGTAVVTLLANPVFGLLVSRFRRLVFITATYALFDASFRGLQRAITRPARETLFTVVTREDKYKSKAFTDTFVYRSGDVLGAWTEGLLGRLGFALFGLAAVAAPLALLWGGLGLWLGLTQRRIARERTAGAPAPAAASSS